MRADPNEPFDLHGALNGFVVTFGGREVACWPTLTGAARGLTLAKEAQAELMRVLRRVKTQGEGCE